MDAWTLLLTSDFGLMSLGVIIFIIGMAAFFLKMFNDKAAEEQKALAGKDSAPKSLN